MEPSPKRTHDSTLVFLSYLAVAFFACIVLLNLILMVLGLAYALYHRNPFSTDEAGMLALVFRLMGQSFGLDGMIRFGTIVVFFVWSYRAFANLPSLNARRLQHSPSATIGWWFVPFANLVVPFIVLRELWQASDPDLTENDDVKRSQLGTPDLLAFWWPILLLSLVSAFITTLLLGTPTTGESPFYPGFLIVTCVLRGTAAVMISLFILEVKRRQGLRFQRLALRRFSTAPPPPPNFEDGSEPGP